MKEASPASDSYIFRIRSWASSKAYGLSPFSKDKSRPPTLPLNNHHVHHEDAHQTVLPATCQLDGIAPLAANPTANHVADQTSPDNPPPAPPPQAEGQGPVVEDEQPNKKKKNIAVRFWLTAKSIILSSYINLLLVLVPVGIAAKAAGLKPGIVFGLNAVAIIPLAGLLSHATESVAKRMGDTVGALMNVTFGNAVELIIFIALQKNEIRIVQASLLGSILANLLLILGMCFLIGGLRFREQIYNSTVTQMSACLLSLSVMSLLLPTAFHASFNSDQEKKATNSVLKVSRGTSVILLIVYGMYLLFQLKSHAYMYVSTPQHIIDEESVPGPVAQWMESSDGSESSDSDSDRSSSSNTTVKRLRRVLAGRRRRKSSSCSKDTADVDAVRSLSLGTGSISPDHTDAVESPHSLGHEGGQRLGSIDFAEDGDDEGGEKGRRSRKNSIISALTKERKRDRKRRERREKRERKKAQRSGETINEGIVLSTSTEKKPEETVDEPRHVDFDIAEDTEPATDSSQKRAFNLRNISSIRPQIPKTFSQNVFMQPAPDPPAPTGGPIPRVKYGIRRTNSLPDRLNQTYSGPATRVTSVQPAHIPAVIAEKPAGSDEENISRTTAVLLLLISTGLVAVCAEFMVDSINAVVSGNSGLSEAFIGLIILPIVGNAAEHVTAVTVASKNKLDLAIGVAVGSSIQIALFVTPFIVLLGWCMSKDMSLYFTLFETVSLFVSAFIVNFLVLDGRSNYLEGALLCAAYVIIAVAAFFYPQVGYQSVVGGNPDATSRLMRMMF